MVAKSQPMHVVPSGAYLIFVIFSPRAQFLAQFFSTQKRVNRDKTDFATKQRKLQKRSDFATKQWKCDKWCGEIWIVSTWHMQRYFKFIHICYVEKSWLSPHDEWGEIPDFSPWQMYRNLKFLHMADFSPRVWPVYPWQIWGMDAVWCQISQWWATMNPVRIKCCR